MTSKAFVTSARVLPVLVTGATGRIGRLVVARLLDAGVPVRALTRRPNAAGLAAAVDVVAGDLTVPESLDAALQGVGATFLPALLLGGIGFVVGFFGPMIFAPNANQGPMLGMFITGPGGFAVGLIYGVSRTPRRVGDSELLIS